MAGLEEKALPLSGAGLVVEDNVIIAMEMELQLRDLGCSSCLGAADVRTALAIIASRPIRFAVLDVDLGGETSEAVALALAAQATPFLFITGYSDTVQLQHSFPGVPVLLKPFRREELEAAIAICHRAGDGCNEDTVRSVCGH